MNEKILESRLRRALHRQGFFLEKSRARNPEDMEYGRYNIIRSSGGIEAGGQGCEMLTLDEVEAFVGNPKKGA